MTRKALLTYANNFLPQNNQGPNELSVEYVKCGQMPFTLSQDPGDVGSVRVCAWDCREREHGSVLLGLVRVSTHVHET